ncbi:hypothetical protein ACIHIX_45900 [Streptomyces sp. NPDC051913]|uniref:hypothetical protein n=1 Tax=Streptomyces sp. NPDC051913 TaxID=3365676 RepID=UPI0037CEDE76
MGDLLGVAQLGAEVLGQGEQVSPVGGGIELVVCEAVLGAEGRRGVAKKVGGFRAHARQFPYGAGTTEGRDLPRSRR